LLSKPHPQPERASVSADSARSAMTFEVRDTSAGKVVVVIQ
jgi:hypothetical protein